MSLIRFMPPRGTNAQCNVYVGTLGELFVDTDAWQLRMSDGATPGGHVQGGISNLVGCSDVSIVSTGPAYAVGQYLRWGANILSAPVQSAPSTSTSGGTLAAATYYYVVTALNAYGETTVSNEESQVTTGSTSKNTITWAAVSGATGYRIYRGTAAGTENVFYQVGAVTTFTDTGAAATSDTPPTVNTSGSWQNASIVAGDVGGLAASATTDTTNASNISSGTLGGARLPSFTGDVTNSGAAMTIAAAAVTLAKMANLAANSFIGNNTGSAATPVALSPSLAKALLAIGAADVAPGSFATGAFQFTYTGTNQALVISTNSGTPWALALNRSDLGTVGGSSDVFMYNGGSSGHPLLVANCGLSLAGNLTLPNNSVFEDGGTYGLTYGNMVLTGTNRGGYIGLMLDTAGAPSKPTFMSNTSTLDYGVYDQAASVWAWLVNSAGLNFGYPCFDANSGGAYLHHGSLTSGKITVQSGGAASGGSSGDIFLIY